jgi:hypothetical protein
LEILKHELLKKRIFLEDYEFGDDLQGISINEVCNLDIFGIPRRRTSKDKGKNRYGNFLLDFCKGNNVFIMNGRLGKDQMGNLTCRNVNIILKDTRFFLFPFFNLFCRRFIWDDISIFTRGMLFLKRWSSG